MPILFKNNISHPELWGIINDEKIYHYQLTNNCGASVYITNFGATITHVMMPDYAGNFADVVLGYDDLPGYLDDQQYMGCIVGRYANRIAGGLIAIDGVKHQLTTKPEGFHHHGGNIGFNKKIWKTLDHDRQSISLNYLSADGEEGFPGNLNINVKYTLTDDDEILIDIEATTDKTTVLNITGHTYFNLAGHNSGSTLNHTLQLPLDAYLPVKEKQLVTGELRPVTVTVFDFSVSKAIGKDIDQPDEQLLLSNGYDHTWVIKPDNTSDLRIAASLADPESGRALKVYTTEPSVHVYTGNFLYNVKGKNGAIYQKHSGICLETQHYPDSPNQPHFPSTVLRPGEVFKSKTVYEFGSTKL